MNNASTGCSRSLHSSSLQHSPNNAGSVGKLNVDLNVFHSKFMSEFKDFSLPLSFTSADGKVTAALAIACSVVVGCFLLAYQNCRVRCHFSCRKPTRQHKIVFGSLSPASSSFTSHSSSVIASISSLVPQSPWLLYWLISNVLQSISTHLQLFKSKFKLQNNPDEWVSMQWNMRVCQRKSHHF